MTARVVICCGSGGVGKTTTSAALAIRCAQAGARTAVLTIDPARRLADALSVGEIGNTACPVPVPDLPANGSLHAMMLDAKRTFDEVIERFAGSPEARARILGNHYYRFVSTRLAGSHEYMAMEKLYELATSGAYDVVILDTPPSRHALDFLAAPERMANLMDEGVLRWLAFFPASRGGWRMIERGSELLARVLRSMLGERTILDIADFFSSFQSLWEGFRHRSLEVRALLHAPTTRFLLVTTPAPGARAEALHFLGVLQRAQMPFGGFVNRCAVAPAHTESPAFGAPPSGVAEAEWAALVAAIAAVPERRRRLVAAQEAALAELRSHAPAHAPIWRIPELDAEVHDLAGLAVVAAHLPTPDALAAPSA